MPKYKVTALENYTYELEIEAGSADEARTIANELSVTAWIDNDVDSSFIISDVTEINN